LKALLDFEVNRSLFDFNVRKNSKALKYFFSFHGLAIRKSSLWSSDLQMKSVWLMLKIWPKKYYVYSISLRSTLKSYLYNDNWNIDLWNQFWCISRDFILFLNLCQPSIWFIFHCFKTIQFLKHSKPVKSIS
jgi:hypothetical protein